MTATLSIFAVLAIAVWFYQTAHRHGRPGVAWAIGGVIVYYGGFLLWMHGVLRPLLGGWFRNHGFWVGIGMDLSAILFGILAATLLRAKGVVKRGRSGMETPP